MKKCFIPILLLCSIIAWSCQEGENKKDDEKISSNRVVTGLEGSRDQSGQLSTDAKPDIGSGQSGSTDASGQLADSINLRSGSSSTDQDFVHEAVNNNTEEIGMARMAKYQAKDKVIRKIAGEFEKDHLAALKALNAMSSRKKYNNTSIPLPSSNDAATLKAKRGADFDKSWCSLMMGKHKSTIAKYEASEKSISDTELKAWISENLPKLRVHYDHLMAIYGKL